MCGINGVLRLASSAPPLDRDEIERVRDAMASRGPDAAGLWLSPRGDLGLGARRLAIIDPSAAGNQPMFSADGRVTIVFNGEIYNYRELRAEQGGYSFLSDSDTEVLLALYEREGMRMLSRLRGMYAFALWDEAQQRLILARDPYGIKPLYYSIDRDALRFASQVKALERGHTSRDVDPAGVTGFLLWGSVPEPLTFRKAIRCLPAGHFLDITRGRVGNPEPYVDWDTSERATAADTVRAVEDSIRAHLVSDVPVGIFLSAGLDSAMIAALACRHLREKPVTFTLAFDEFRGTPLDEAPGAAAVAKTLGTHHVERRLSPELHESLWDDSLDAMDQPSIDGFNVFLMSRFAHDAGLRVVLSGLGGDELFGSYPSFVDLPRWQRWATLLGRVPGARSLWHRFASVARHRSPKIAGFVGASTLSGAYALKRGLFLPEEIPDLLGGELARDGLAAYSPEADAARVLRTGFGAHAAADAWEGIHRMESALYMRNQLLRDADWASMAHSLELRVPFVDLWLTRRVRAAGFEPARSAGKKGLARLVTPELPPWLFERAKTGFMFPSPPSLTAVRSLGWAHQARRRALNALSKFGIDLDSNAVRRGIGRTNGRRAETLFLLTEAFRAPGGIQRYNRDQIAAIRRCDPTGRLRLLSLNDSPQDVRQAEWAGLDAHGFARNKVRFVLHSTWAALAHRPRRVMFGHRNFLVLAPLLHLAAPTAPRWLLAYGIDVAPKFSPLERALLKHVDRVFAISPQTAAAVREAGWKGPVDLWPCSLPFSWSLPAPSPPRFERPTRLLLVSRLYDRHKGIGHVLRALRLLHDRGTAARLDVVGDGPDRGLLEAQAAKEGLKGSVRFHGRIDTAALQHFYATCDVFVLPSCSEGFGIVYLEAMAYGKPVVGADAGATPYVVRPGVSGFLVPYGDPEKLASCIAGLVEHPDEARRVGLSARAFLEQRFSFDHMVERTRAILDTPE